MKKLRALFVVLPILLSVSLGEAAKKSPFEATARLYFDAYRSNDMAKLKRAVTDRFLKDIGEERWKSILEETHAKYKDSKFELIRPELKKKDFGTVGIRFVLRSGSETVWCTIRQGPDGIWRLDDYMGDYSPEGAGE